MTKIMVEEVEPMEDIMVEKMVVEEIVEVVEVTKEILEVTKEILEVVDRGGGGRD